MADAVPSVAGPTSPAAPVVAYALGLGGACLLAWAAAAAFIGAPPSHPRPGDDGGALHWAVTWLWLAPLPYAFAWFVLVSRHPSRAFLALVVLGVVTGVIAPFAAFALLALGPLVVLGSVPVAILFGVGMSALQDDVPAGLVDEWRSAHVRGCFLALAPFSFVMATFYAMALTPAGAPSRSVQLVAPLAVLAVGWCFHAVWCWRLLPPERRAAAPWRRIALLLGGLAIILLAAFMRA